MAGRRCSTPTCDRPRFAEGMSCAHAVIARAERGDRCSIDECETGRFTGRPPAGLCARHWSAAYRLDRPRDHARYPRTCERCGADWTATRKTARSCPACAGAVRARTRTGAARERRLPVLHPNPDPLTWLPARHPARRPATKRTDWWQVLVSGPCAWCRETFTDRMALGATPPAYCSKRCASAAGKSRRGRFLVSPKARLAIYERDGWICQLCADPVDPTLGPSDPWAATLDHVECQAWSLVPDHSPANLRLAHRWCNSVRGDERFYTAADLRAS